MRTSRSVDLKNTHKIIFVTGTDTGVGKTLLAGLLLHHLRQNGNNALAMKPFCSGGRQDVRLLQSLQAGELTDAEMNPWYFSQPVAPLVAAKQYAKPIRLAEVVRRIKALKNKCETLVVEGSGGLLVPLGKGFTVADLIAELDCKIIVVGRNRLGTINHTLLTVQALKNGGISAKNVVIVMMREKQTDPSVRTNQSVLRELLAPIGVFEVPFLGEKASTKTNIAAKSGQLEAIFTGLTNAVDQGCQALLNRLPQAV